MPEVTDGGTFTDGVLGGMSDVSINWVTGVITVPWNFCTWIMGTLYELDTNEFREKLKELEAAEEGIVFTDTHVHNVEVTVAGTTYSRTIEIIVPYSITFVPDAQWTVRLAGSNNNIFDVENMVLNQNQVQVIPTNSGGLISSAEMASRIATIHKSGTNKKILMKVGSTWHLVLYDNDGTTEIRNKILRDKDGNDIDDLAAGVLAQELQSSV